MYVKSLDRAWYKVNGQYVWVMIISDYGAKSLNVLSHQFAKTSKDTIAIIIPIYRQETEAQKV